MSIDLTVKLRHAVELTSLLAATHRICCQIRDLPAIPPLQAYVADARPLVSALAASIAIALAQLTGSSVVDDGLEWNTIFEQSPQDFAAAVRVAGPFKDVWEAVDAFAAAMQQRSS